MSHALTFLNRATRLDGELIAYLETPYRTHWWGSWWDVQPQCLPEVFGDGQLLLTVQPTNTRPHYYVVAVDSSWWDSEANDLDDDRIHDEIDPILDALEEYFGVAWDEDADEPCEECCGLCEWCEDQGWPLVDLQAGFSWGCVGTLEEARHAANWAWLDKARAEQNAKVQALYDDLDRRVEQTNRAREIRIGVFHLIDEVTAMAQAAEQAAKATRRSSVAFLQLTESAPDLAYAEVQQEAIRLAQTLFGVPAHLLGPS